MVKLLILVALVGVATAGTVPQSARLTRGTPEQAAQIRSQSSDIKEDGSYRWAYESDNGIKAEEQGSGGQGAQGSFVYTSPEGTAIQTTYVADANGFVASGPHIPQPHPIPEEILKSIAYNKANAKPGDEGQWDGKL